MTSGSPDNDSKITSISVGRVLKGRLRLLGDKFGMLSGRPISLAEVIERILDEHDRMTRADEPG